MTVLRNVMAAFAASLSLLFLGVAAVFAGDGAQWRIESSDETVRPDIPESESLGGMVWITNDVYWAVNDRRPVVWEMSLPVEMSNGKITGCSLRRLFDPEDSIDVEAIALDPIDGAVWLADEHHNRIARHDPANGRLTGEAILPKAMQSHYPELGLESLTIAPDGLVMWTCSEEALTVDGSRSTRKSGSDVRLTKLQRRSAADAWTVSGQWIYRTDPIAGGPWYIDGCDSARSGVAELCLLDDGSLLVLEREFSKVLVPRLRCRIYVADTAEATEVHGLAAVADIKDVRRVSKRKLYETSGFSMYEGMCLGPKLADGSTLLVLVADGDGHRALRSVMTLRLYRH